jgi:hypothetical protein
MAEGACKYITKAARNFDLIYQRIRQKKVVQRDVDDTMAQKQAYIRVYYAQSGLGVDYAA